MLKLITLNLYLHVQPSILLFAGQADSVRCFLCGTGLRNWDPEDEPWVEHARWAPECFYVRDNKGQEFINLVQVAVRQQQMVGELI